MAGPMKKEAENQLWRPLLKSTKHKSDDTLLETAGKAVLNNPLTGIPADVARAALGSIVGGIADVIPESIKKHAPWDGNLEEKIDGKADEQKSYTRNLTQYVLGLVNPLKAGDGNVIDTRATGLDAAFAPLISPGYKSSDKKSDETKKKTEDAMLKSLAGPATGGAAPAAPAGHAVAAHAPRRAP